MTMKPYRVFGGVVRLGPGTAVEIDADQYKTRAHNVEVLARRKGEKTDFMTVRSTAAVLHFKRGETIGLPDIPPNLVGIIEPVGEAKSEHEKVAAEKASEHRAAAKPAGAAKPKAR